MDINSEKKKLKTAKDNLKIAKDLLPQIIQEANFEAKDQDILWSKIEARKKELDSRDRVITTKENQLANLGSEQSFKIKNKIRIISYSHIKGEIIIEDGKSEPVIFENKFFAYIYHLAQKNIQDNYEKKSHLDIGWIRDKELINLERDWEQLSSVRGARRRALEYLEDEGSTWSGLIEKARVNIHNKNKGFRISSPCIIIEDKSPKG